MAQLRFTPRQLDAFITVADMRSFTAASQRLSLSASAVSQLIAELEQTIGFRLFDRSTRLVSLSSAGKEFLASAETAVKHLRQAESAAADVRNRAAGVVRIAAPMVLASVMLPEAIQAYQQKQPKVVVRIRDASVERLVDMVASGDADLAVGPDRATGDEVQRHLLCESAWVLWCAYGHPLAAKPELRWSDLRNTPLVAAGRDHERNVAQMSDSLPEDQRIGNIDVVDNITTALGIARAGLAATLSPEYVGALARPLGLTMRRVVDPEIMRYLCLYQPVRRATSPAAEGFAEHLSEWLPQWNKENGAA
ncbi:LysR family transcriptional regulator [Herbaspirillum sp. RTI4]|uniref:LysR family transcriptional regulator n=1 Tax=Herbaspirillum sp. RTI4 TaxID=3048640 RepID=UPI002AB456FD|nr:LysR family transcriptional regulator [Herbaspirillum sp. RTI4]MDY7579968.1 LysR family transcriptional regulator [Herbaspirillum sp. RTI4]MEA9982888.1 LysR family transcriptional regulator [Herbaspirillum sp. RTI4]